MNRLLQTILLFGTFLLSAQNINDYLGPSDSKNSKTRSLIRVQIAVYDDKSPQGVQIQKAEFDQNSISLKPRDINGFRGQASFQNRPGKYKLKWTVQRDKIAWPRTETHEVEVTLDPRDLWLQITITGDTAQIQ
jgi:hypothetical protein